jgi:hypothetical protein
VIVWVKFARSLPYLLATATSINLTNSSGVRLGVTVDVAVAVVVMAGTVFLINHVHVFLETCELPPTRLNRLLLEFLLEHPPRCLRQILHCHTDRVVSPTTVWAPLSFGLVIASTDSPHRCRRKKEEDPHLRTNK